MEAHHKPATPVWSEQIKFHESCGLEVVDGFGKGGHVNLVEIERFVSFDKQDLEAIQVTGAMKKCQNRLSVNVFLTNDSIPTVKN